MLVIPKFSQLPKNKVTFLEAFNDTTGEIRSSYINQQAYKLPNFAALWGMSMVPGMHYPLMVAKEKFERDKAHYLETGELPKDF